MSDEHWWHRLAGHIQDWLHENHGEPLDAHVLDAVIRAGGIPQYRATPDQLPDSPYLSDEDWEYIKEQRRAG